MNVLDGMIKLLDDIDDQPSNKDSKKPGKPDAAKGKSKTAEKEELCSIQ
jgi:hypothetical protein